MKLKIDKSQIAEEELEVLREQEVQVQRYLAEKRKQEGLLKIRQAQIEAEKFPDCDGKKCGLGKYVGGKTYLCIHNNLAIKRPELIAEWDWGKNKKSPQEYTPYSSKGTVNWICMSEKNNCGCHRWSASPNTRDRCSCPYCAGKKTCYHQSFAFHYPQLLPEWDIELNIGKDPATFSVKSHEVIIWRCRDEKNKCGCHVYPAPISSKTDGHDCPYCHRKPCSHNNLLVLYPKLCEQWDYERNAIRPEEFLPGSHERIYWKCDKCPYGCHKWPCAVRDRVSGYGCPFCGPITKQVCAHYNMATLFPKIAADWDHAENKLGPENYSKSSNYVAHWLCKNGCGSKWSCRIADRTRGKYICSVCYPNQRCSKAQIKWLEDIITQENIDIRHALPPDGEYKIDGVGKVDGYCEETNTVYEYHGVYWHGHPNFFDPDDINTLVGKTFGELYTRTLERDNRIRKLGYNLIVKWEKDDQIGCLIEDVDD